MISAASPDAAAALALEVADLSKAFGGIHAVDGVSMRIPTGQRRAIIGPNGAGKTLFACLTGALRPTAGRIALFGQDVTGVAEHRLAAMGVGRTYQITNVFPGLTVLENVLLALHGTSLRKWVPRRTGVHRSSPTVPPNCASGPTVAVSGERPLSCEAMRSVSRIAAHDGLG